MNLLLPVAGIIFAAFIMAKSADLLVSATVRIAKILKMGDFAVGFFVLGMATTSPEIFIGLNSAIAGEPELSVGNLIGATIMLLSLIIGGNAIINGRVFYTKSFNFWDMFLTLGVIFLPVFYLTDGKLNRWEGLCLLTGYLAFTTVMSRRHTVGEHIRENLFHHHHIFKTLLWMLLGIAGLTLGSKIAIAATDSLAMTFKMPLFLVGALMLAFGTNLPEIIIMLTALKKKHNQVGMGDFLGSAVANTPVLGTVALIRPLNIYPIDKLNHDLFILGLLLLAIFGTFSWGKRITRGQGAILVGFFMLFLVSQFIF